MTSKKPLCGNHDMSTIRLIRAFMVFWSRPRTNKHLMPLTYSKTGPKSGQPVQILYFNLTKNKFNQSNTTIQYLSSLTRVKQTYTSSILFLTNTTAMTINNDYKANPIIRKTYFHCQIHVCALMRSAHHRSKHGKILFISKSHSDSYDTEHLS